MASERAILLSALLLPAVAVAAPAPAPQAAPACVAPPAESDGAARRRPGRATAPAAPAAPACPPAPRAVLQDALPIPVPDRWRIVESIGVEERWYDPYNQNTLKGDRPLGGEWFMVLGATADIVIEPRRLPTPIGSASSAGPGANDVFGDAEQLGTSTSLILEFALLEGDTTFRPPDFEFRFIPVLNLNTAEVEQVGLLNADPAAGSFRRDQHFGVQGLFADWHLRNVSERYDFDSLRVGIQPFNADFRGFLFQDAPLGIRLFGTRANNRYQYNLAWFRRLEKDTNSGLNDVAVALRDEDLFVANLYLQDSLALGFTSQFVLLHDANRESDDPFYDANGFLQRPVALGQQRPRDYDVTYVGYNGDGRAGRFGLTLSAYLALGDETAGVFTGTPQRIAAGFLAGELAYDSDWVRYRLHGAYATGDGDPFDDKAEGYDAVFENPLLAGADTSFWVRQGVPLIGGGRVALSGRNGILNSLRSSKDHGQANFANPGLRLLGVGADLDLTPRLRVTANLSGLWFDETAVLEAARAQSGIPDHIGEDVSVALIYRPLMSQNIVLRLSAAALLPGDGYRALYEDETPFSVLANLIFTY
jgi:hypothetical protein